MPIIAPQNRRVNSIGRPAAEAPLPDVGVVGQLGSVFRTTEDDVDVVQEKRLYDAYGEVEEALVDLGVDRAKLRDSAIWSPFGTPSIASRPRNKDAIWAALDSYRQSDPSKFAELPKTKQEYEQWALNRKGAARRDQQIAANANIGIQLVGGMAGSFTDPFNVLTLPIGAGGKTVAQVALREMILNAGLEGYQQFDLAASRRARGDELTAGEAALNIAGAGLGGAVLGAAGKYGADNFDAIKAAPKAAQEALWAKIAPMLPEKIRPKMDWDAIGDDMLPDIAEGLIGRENLSEAEADALAVVRRESAIEARNPFQPDGAGTRVHAENLAEAMQRIFDAPTPSGSGAQVRAAVPRVSRETLNRGTSISSGVVPGDARSVMKSRIKTVESSGSNVARNPNSTALGPYQFLKGTWSRLYRSRYGDTGKSAAEIAALRTDPRINEILMDDLMAHNEASLRGAGIAPTAGNLYLAHFAGDAGARKLHRSPPGASARSVLGDLVVDSNPFLARMNAADVINWAAVKMGGKGGAVAPAGRSVDIDPEAAVRADLERQQAQIDADRAAIDDIAPRPSLIDDDILPEPIADGSDIPVLTTPIEGLARPAPIASPAVPPRLPTPIANDVADILPQLRAIVRDRAQSLNEPAKLAKALGIDEGKLRSGLTELALSREIRQNKKGQFMRLPVENGPVDLLKFIGRAGGLSEDGVAPGARDIIGGSQGHRLGKGGRDYNKRLIPGSGPLVRKGGRSVESIGELLHEAGYFGDPQGPRPSEAQVLEMIDLAATQGQKIYPFGQTPDEPIRGSSRSIFQDEEQEYYTRRLFDEVAEANGYSMDDDHFAAAARILLTEDVDTMDDAVRLMVNRQIEDYRAALFYEVEDDINASIEDQFAEAWARDNGLDPENLDGPAPIGRNEGEGGAAARDANGNAALGREGELEPPYLDQGALRAFDDPDGPAAMGVVDSLEHDLRAVLDPAIAERQAQLASLKAASPMQAKVDQESTIGSPLFDAVDQPTFRLDDEGDPIAPADLLAEIDAEDAMIKTIKDCL